MQILYIGIDTNALFQQDFKIIYKNITCNYICGKNNEADCIIAKCTDIEQGYQIVTELVSILAYGGNLAFRIGFHHSSLAPASIDINKYRHSGRGDKKMFNYNLTQINSDHNQLPRRIAARYELALS